MPFRINIRSTPLVESQITAVNRSSGYVPRYFAAKSNQIDKKVFEITRRDYEYFQDNKYIVLGHLNWTIKGNLVDRAIWVYTGSPVHDDMLESPRRGTEPINIPGVLTQNEGAVRFLSRKIPAVENYLTDYKQFYDET